MNNLWPHLSRAVLCVISCSHAAAQSEPTPAPANPGSFVEVGDSKLYYQEWGRASQTVVLVHDGVVDSAVWNGVWSEFCKHFHTIRYDRRGYGRSPAATTWYSETDDLAMLLHHLKITRAAIVGSSHGGELSIDFTLAHPEMVQQLVLVGAVVSGMPYSQHFLDRGKWFYPAWAILCTWKSQRSLATWSSTLSSRTRIEPGAADLAAILRAKISAVPLGQARRRISRYAQII